MTDATLVGEVVWRVPHDAVVRASVPLAGVWLLLPWRLSLRAGGGVAGTGS